MFVETKYADTERGKVSRHLLLKSLKFPGKIHENFKLFPSSHLIKLIGTNNAANCSSSNIVACILNLKEWIKTQVPHCKVLYNN